MPVNTAKRISYNYTEKNINTFVVVDTAELSYLMIDCNNIDVEKMKFLIWKDEILPNRFWNDLYKNIKIDYYIEK
jgi:hypothetical protein